VVLVIYRVNRVFGGVFVTFKFNSGFGCVGISRSLCVAHCFVKQDVEI
jgi:hypothetical protein